MSSSSSFLLWNLYKIADNLLSIALAVSSHHTIIISSKMTQFKSWWLLTQLHDILPPVYAFLVLALTVNYIGRTRKRGNVCLMQIWQELPFFGAFWKHFFGNSLIPEGQAQTFRQCQTSTTFACKFEQISLNLRFCCKLCTNIRWKNFLNRNWKFSGLRRYASLLLPQHWNSERRSLSLAAIPNHALRRR